MKLKVKIEPIEYRNLPQLRISIKTDGYEIINIKALLNILKWLFRSEDIRYPPEKGFQGKYKPLHAIQDVCEGFPVEQVVRKHECRDAERDIIEWIENPPEKNWKEWTKEVLSNKNEEEKEC